MDTSDRQGDQSRRRIIPILRNDERSTVGLVVANLGWIVAVPNDEISGLGIRRYLHLSRACPEAHENDAADQYCDQCEAADASRCQCSGWMGGGVHGRSFRE